MRYVLSYYGPLFHGDTDGLNLIRADHFADVSAILAAYGKDDSLKMLLEDRLTGMSYTEKDGWY